MNKELIETIERCRAPKQDWHDDGEVYYKKGTVIIDDRKRLWVINDDYTGGDRFDLYPVTDTQLKEIFGLQRINP